LLEGVAYEDADPDADFFDGWKKIMARHVDEGCPEEVNIPQLLAKKLIDMKNGDVPNVTRFVVTKELEKAEKEVVGMIAGIFPRFKSSAIFKAYLQNTALQGSSSKKLTVGGSGKEAKAPTRVLLCDNDELTRLVLEHIFTVRGYEVFTAANGEIALQLLQDEMYDIVLVNNELSKMCAIEVMGHHKTTNDGKNRQARFICMISDSNSRTKKNAIAVGYNAVLKKPFNIDDFEAVKGGSTTSIGSFFKR
jgi:CheY-like chemotaxis protein